MQNAVAAALVFAASGLLGAQSGLQPQSTGTGAIIGRVVEAGTDKPIPNARLWMRQTRGDPPDGVYSRSENLTTDSAGTFAFRNLPAGQFAIDANADGYQDSAIGKRRPDSDEAWITLKEGQTFSNATIELFRGGTISGVVTNERGEPMKEVHLGTWRRTRDGGLVSGSGAISDATGAYRMTAVPPGEHYVMVGVWHDTVREEEPIFAPCVVAAPLPPGAPPRPVEKPKHAIGDWYTRMARWIPEPGPDEHGNPRTVPSTLYPGVSELPAALAVSILAGEERTGIDIQMRPVTTTTVEGRVVPLPGQRVPKGSEVTLRLMGTPSSASEHRTWVQPDKTFRFLGVPAGHYMLELQIKEWTSCDTISRRSEDVPTEVPLDVPITGLKDVVVEVASGRTLQGRIRFDGKSAPPMHTDLWLVPTAGGESKPVDWDHGSLISGDGLLPGSYAFRVTDNALQARWFMQSMTLRSTNLVTHPVAIDRDNVDGVEVTMTDRPSRLEGTVVDSEGKLVRDSTVVAFPVDRTSWSTAHDFLAGFERTRALDGTYRIEHLVPGDYFVTAVDERRMGEWPRAVFLETLAKQAAPVRLAIGESQTLRLTLQKR